MEGGNIVVVLLLVYSIRSFAQNPVLNCYCENQRNCINNSCASEHRCETSVDIYNNGTIRIHFICVDDFLSCIPLPSPNQNPQTYARCCDDSDYCNRCQLPDNVPPNIDLFPYLPAECRTPSHTASHSPSPSPTLSMPTGTIFTEAQPTVSQSPSLSSHSTNFSSPTPVPPSSFPSSLPWWLIVIIVLASLSVVLCIVLGLVVTCALQKRRRKNIEVYSINDLANFEAGMGETIGTASGSSGAGLTRLEPRTIAREIKKVELIGKGRYGEVWLGTWCSEDVAIKIFSGVEKDSFERECNIFKTYGLHHDNIVRYIISDTKCTNWGLELWMVIEYHPNGSLYDYLQLRTLTPSQLHKMVYSISSGLHYLHQDIQSGQTDEKPGIAHRDLKSRNILVKSDGTCCITDLGLALRNVILTGCVDKTPTHPRQGTKRYMAPEILDGSLNTMLFDSYKLVDIYCFGLIMWELARRCEVNGEVNDYQLPYFDSVSHDPSFEEMKKVVVGQEIRPKIEKRWKEDETVAAFSSIMQECWRANPQARLSAFRIKKTSAEIRNGFKMYH